VTGGLLLGLGRQWFDEQQNTEHERDQGKYF
jgi:hypothetical protein